MTLLLIDLLLNDHRHIRALYDRLVTECEQPRSEAWIEHFRHFKAFVIAQAKAKEFVLYALVDEPNSERAARLQHFAFEGYEQHDLMDFLMKEMGQAEEITLQWRAQLKVLGEMLERHLIEEEKDFFPEMRRVLSEVNSAGLSEAYLKERDMIFAKKRGLRPAPTLASSLAH